MIKLVLGGFPCIQFSIAQKVKRINKIDFTADEFIDFRNSYKDWWLHISEFEKQIGEKLKKNGDFPQDEKYEFALGLHLFLNCIVAYDRMAIEAEKTGDKIYYFFENVNSMKKEIKEVMEEILSRLYGGVMNTTNSALVSAQNRKRIYFTNFGDIEQPEDRQILLKDVLDSGIAFRNEKSYCLDANYYKGGNLTSFNKQSGQRLMVAEPVCVAQRGRYTGESGEVEQHYEPRDDGKTNTVTTVLKDNMIAEPIVLNDVDGKSGTIRATCYKDGIRNLVGNNVDKRTCVAELVVNNEFTPVNNPENNNNLKFLGGIKSNRKQWLDDGKQFSRNFSQGNRVYSTDGKSASLTAQGGGIGSNTGLYAIELSEEILPYTEKKIKEIVDKYGYLPERFNPYNSVEINEKSPTLTAQVTRQSNSGTTMCIIPIEDINSNTSAKYLLKNLKRLDEKSCNLTASCYKGIGSDGTTTIAIPFTKSNENYQSINKPITIYEVKDGQITIKGEQYPIKLPDGYYIIRKLTVSECRRLQTIPDWYIMNCSKSQNYKMLGNGWTNKVVEHYLSHIPNIDSEEIEVLSLYDGMSGGMIALTELGVNVKKYVAYEIDKYAIQTTKDNFDIVEHRGDAFAVRDENWIY